MAVLFDVYVFISWFGSWSTSSGFGAFLIFVLWTSVLVFSVVSSYIGGWFSIVMTIASMGSNLLLAPAIALGAWVLYFVGLGDWLSQWLPRFFPAGGYLFSKASPSSLEIIVFVIWIGLRVASFQFIKKLKNR